MSTKDPHIALIDAHEQLEQIKKMTRDHLAKVKAKVLAGQKLTEIEKEELAQFRQRVIDATKYIQDRLYVELEGHGLKI